MKQFSHLVPSRKQCRFLKKSPLGGLYHEKICSASPLRSFPLPHWLRWQGRPQENILSPKFDALDGVSGLIISTSNLEVSRLSETKMNPLTMSAETKSYLQFTGEYSIANADSKAVVASGTLKARVHLGFAMGKGDWEENMKNLVEEILKDTPLQKK